LSLKNIQSVYQTSAKVNQLAEFVAIPEKKAQIQGLIGSSLSFVIEALFEKTALPFLLLLNDK
jgi:transcription-repair coupling factor (superfamily II helicase)